MSHSSRGWGDEEDEECGAVLVLKPNRWGFRMTYFVFVLGFCPGNKEWNFQAGKYFKALTMPLFPPDLKALILNRSLADCASESDGFESV